VCATAGIALDDIDLWVPHQANYRIIDAAARRIGLPLERVIVELSHGRIHAADCETCETKEGMIDRIERTIALRGNLDAEQRERLLEIADKCPVHRTLTSEVDIRTIERRDVDDEPIAQ